MKLRPYQEEVLVKLNQALKVKDEVVIASAPNSGKTLMAIEFMKQESNKTFLVLTHGTIVLKEQWSEKFAEAGLKFSEQLGQERVTYGLPQGVYRKAGAPVDYLIIDEAHEFTFAEMVKEIKTKFKPKKIIYLTGTPSKFIAKGYETIIVPAIDLIKQGYSSDLYVGMVSTTANIDKDDYNADGDVKEKKATELEATVETDLDSLLAAMHARLCETGAFKGSPRLRKTVEWAPTLGKLQKTMIACRSIKQANKIEKYFDIKGINCLVSHSLNDVQSENIQLFKTSAEYQVLIVVDRGILGFDMHDLVNVVDLTCSKNINRIYQLYARVMRQSKDNPKKYFFKFATDPEMQLMKFYMNASLMLMFEDFISKYNGKNLNGCKVPVMVPRSPRNSEAGVGSSKSKVLNKSINIDKLFMETVQAGAVLIDIYNKIGQNTNEYAYTTFGEIKEKQLGISNRDPDTKKIEILKLARSGADRPSMHSSDSSESSYGRAVTNYSTLKSPMYDDLFVRELKSIRPDWFRGYKTKMAKDQLIKMASAGLEKPKHDSYLGGALSQFVSQRASQYDSLFKEKIELLNPNWKEGKLERSMARMLKLMPRTVQFIKGQKWKGIKHRYKFMDIDLGIFTGVPSQLTGKSWKRGNSGHPTGRLLAIGKKHQKKIKNTTTGEVFNSARIASNFINLQPGAVSVAVHSGGKAGGYNWAYCDDEGNVIEIKRTQPKQRTKK